jgi:hypothetical protein
MIQRSKNRLAALAKRAGRKKRNKMRKEEI